MVASTNETVGGWQAALMKTAADFGAVAADNLKKQVERDAEKNRVEPPGPNWRKIGLIVAGVLVVLVAVKKLKLI